jgi:hypothetical protein
MLLIVAVRRNAQGETPRQQLASHACTGRTQRYGHHSWCNLWTAAKFSQGLRAFYFKKDCFTQ